MQAAQIEVGKQLVKLFCCYMEMSLQEALAPQQLQEAASRYPNMCKKVRPQAVYTMFEQGGWAALVDAMAPLYKGLTPQGDDKSQLQEYMQSRRETVAYRVVSESGPAHARRYRVEVCAMGRVAEGEASSKKEAEKKAARAYLERYQIEFSRGSRKKRPAAPSALLANRRRTLSEARQKQLESIRQALDLDQDQLPLHLLDLCMTRKSNELLAALGSYVCLFAAGHELLRHFDTLCAGQAKQLPALRGTILSKPYMEQHVPDEWMLTGKQDFFQAVVGAVFWHAIQMKRADVFQSAIVLLRPLIDKYSSDSDAWDSSTWLQETVPALDLEWGWEQVESSGGMHSRSFCTTVAIFVPGSQEIFFKGVGHGPSKKESKRRACRDIHQQLRERLFLNAPLQVPETEEWSIFLQKVIRLALQPGVYQKENLQLVGGLLFEAWSEREAACLIENLERRMMHTEIEAICSRWLQKYPAHLLKKTSKPLAAPVKPTAPSTKMHRVHTRLYRFDSECCHVCESDLQRLWRHVQGQQGEKTVYLQLSLPSCLVCGITGMHEQDRTRLEEKGISVPQYTGSPYYFESTVLQRAFPAEEVRKNRPKSPESLSKELEIKRKIGWKGEEIVYLREKDYLERLNRRDLSAKVRWVSKEDCAAGYDIVSFFPDGREKYIEVKSTSSSGKSSFEITLNEWRTAEALGDAYFIYQVANVYHTPQIKKIHNPYQAFQREELVLKPIQFRARFNT